MGSPVKPANDERALATPMETRPLGRTGLRVSRLGYGCSGIWGMRYFSERDAVRLVHQAAELGITLFDTGAFYCGGEAERRLGVALRELKGGDVIVSTKTGTHIGVGGRLYKDFSETSILNDVDVSLRRLGREALDILHLHGPDEQQIRFSLETLLRLKETGKIRAIGVCGAGAPLTYAASTGGVDVLMGAYNVLERGHESLMKQARAAGLGVLAIAPLAQGLYRRNFFAPKSIPDLWYIARAVYRNRNQLKRARAAQALHDIDGWSAPEAALAFTLANPAVDCAVSTSTRSAHLAMNAAAAKRSLSPDV
ncbi:MAG: aldo/keto reductase, partial [Pseudomonadota bacterium]